MNLESYPKWLYRIALRFALLRFLMDSPNSSLDFIINSLFGLTGGNIDSDVVFVIKNELNSMEAEGMIKSETILTSGSGPHYYIDWWGTCLIDITSGIPERKVRCNVGLIVIKSLDLDLLMEKFCKNQYMVMI